MELWGKDDVFSRWLNALCAAPLLALILLDVYLFTNGVFAARLTCLCCVAAPFAFKFLRYAVTGRNNINREDF